jgi:DNA-directed RNA polymerase I, II, and III subunit RPABC2
MDKEDIEIEIEDSETESETNDSETESESDYEPEKKTNPIDDIKNRNVIFNEDDDDYIESDNDENDEVDEIEDLGIFKNKDDVVDTILKSTQNKNLINRDDFSEDDDEDDDDEDIDENYLQKLDNGVKNNIISEYHPELMVHNMDEVEAACVIVRDSNGVIVDRMHKTLPFVTRYEKARVLGERAKQINAGAKPFIEISDSLIDGYLIALKEFEQKKIPFIVRRPLPNGGSEYWRLRDLEILE